MRKILNVYQLNAGDGVQFELSQVALAAKALLRLFDLRGPQAEEYDEDEDSVNFYRDLDAWQAEVAAKPWYSQAGVEAAWEAAQSCFRLLTRGGEALSCEALTDFAHTAYGQQCEILGFGWDTEDVPRIREQVIEG